jgi:hypothetical protein
MCLDAINDRWSTQVDEMEDATNEYYEEIAQELEAKKARREYREYNDLCTEPNHNQTLSSFERCQSCGRPVMMSPCPCQTM